MTKLRLKRTPEERAAHELRKSAKRARRNRDDIHSPSSKRSRTHARSSSPSGSEYGPQPSSSYSHSQADGDLDYERIRAEIEEQKFREKMFDAMDDDERLDSVEARLNDFAQVPQRWRTEAQDTAGRTRNYYDDEDDGWMRNDPRYMDDEEYAEWIRAGMYRKTHAEEYEERKRQKAVQAAEAEAKRTEKEAWERIEKERAEERRKYKREKETRRWEKAKDKYEKRWKVLLLPASVEDNKEVGQMRFVDIPWPVRVKSDDVRLEDLEPDTIETFLLGEEKAKERKDKLRSCMLRYHPDKFERLMNHIRQEERDKVKEGVGKVARALNTLMASS